MKGTHKKGGKTKNKMAKQGQKGGRTQKRENQDMTEMVDEEYTEGVPGFS